MLKEKKDRLQAVRFHDEGAEAILLWDRPRHSEDDLLAG